MQLTAGTGQFTKLKLMKQIGILRTYDNNIQINISERKNQLVYIHHFFLNKQF